MSAASMRAALGDIPIEHAAAIDQDEPAQLEARTLQRPLFKMQTDTTVAGEDGSSDEEQDAIDKRLNSLEALRDKLRQINQQAQSLAQVPTNHDGAPTASKTPAARYFNHELMDSAFAASYSDSLALSELSELTQPANDDQHWTMNQVDGRAQLESAAPAKTTDVDNSRSHANATFASSGLGPSVPSTPAKQVHRSPDVDSHLHEDSRAAASNGQKTVRRDQDDEADLLAPLTPMESPLSKSVAALQHLQASSQSRLQRQLEQHQQEMARVTSSMDSALFGSTVAEDRGVYTTADRGVGQAARDGHDQSGEETSHEARMVPVDNLQSITADSLSARTRHGREPERDATLWQSSSLLGDARSDRLNNSDNNDDADNDANDHNDDNDDDDDDILMSGVIDARFVTRRQPPSSPSPQPLTTRLAEVQLDETAWTPPRGGGEPTRADDDGQTGGLPDVRRSGYDNVSARDAYRSGGMTARNAGQRSRRLDGADNGDGDDYQHEHEDDNDAGPAWTRPLGNGPASHQLAAENSDDDEDLNDNHDNNDGDDRTAAAHDTAGQDNTAHVTFRDSHADNLTAIAGASSPHTPSQKGVDSSGLRPRLANALLTPRSTKLEKELTATRQRLRLLELQREAEIAQEEQDLRRSQAVLLKVEEEQARAQQVLQASLHHETELERRLRESETDRLAAEQAVGELLQHQSATQQVFAALVEEHRQLQTLHQQQTSELELFRHSMTSTRLRHSPVETVDNSQLARSVDSHRDNDDNTSYHDTLGNDQNPAASREFHRAVELELHAYQQRIEQLEASLRLAVREKDKAEQEAKDAQGQLGDLERAAGKARREAEQSKEQVAGLEMEVRELRSTRSDKERDLQRDYDQLKSQMLELNADYKRIQAQNNHLSRQLERYMALSTSSGSPQAARRQTTRGISPTRSNYPAMMAQQQQGPQAYQPQPINGTMYRQAMPPSQHTSSYASAQPYPVSQPSNTTGYVPSRPTEGPVRHSPARPHTVPDHITSRLPVAKQPVMGPSATRPQPSRSLRQADATTLRNPDANLHTTLRGGADNTSALGREAALTYRISSAASPSSSGRSLSRSAQRGPPAATFNQQIPNATALTNDRMLTNGDVMAESSAQSTPATPHHANEECDFNIFTGEPRSTGRTLPDAKRNRLTPSTRMAWVDDSAQLNGHTTVAGRTSAYDSNGFVSNVYERRNRSPARRQIQEMSDALHQARVARLRFDKAS